MTNAINNRYDFLFFFDVKDGNPNGDPDADNLPRIDPEDMRGLVTDVCIKRKVRNYLSLMVETNSLDATGNQIFIKHQGVLEEEQAKPFKELGLKGKTLDNTRQARNWMCENFYDVRTFGAVMSTTDFNCGQVRGPVQFTFSRSIDPIMSLEHTITRMAVTKKDELKPDKPNQTMGRKSTLSYGLYKGAGFVSPAFAMGDNGTGFSDADLNILWKSLKMGFEVDRSASKGVMTMRKIIVFKHDSALGNAQAQELFERVSCKRNDGVTVARDYGDYTISINRDGLTAGVEIIEM